jgi:hypothetical protein
LENDLRAEGFVAKAYYKYPSPSRLAPGTSAVVIFIGGAPRVGTVGAIAGRIVGKVIDRYRRRPPDTPSPTVVIYWPDNEELARVKVTPQGSAFRA